jgi:hypothetical protein
VVTLVGGARGRRGEREAVRRIAAAVGDHRRETFCLGMRSAERVEIPRVWRGKGKRREVSLSAFRGNPSGGLARCGSFSSPNVTLLEIFPKMRASLVQESGNILL